MDTIHIKINIQIYINSVSRGTSKITIIIIQSVSKHYSE